MKSLFFSFILLAGVLFSCKDVEMDRICEPEILRNFNIVYNAHFKGQLIFNNTCNDTAYVLRTDMPNEVVPPGKQVSYNLTSGEQYYIAINCSDSSHTYIYQNTCP